MSDHESRTGEDEKASGELPEGEVLTQEDDAGGQGDDGRGVGDESCLDRAMKTRGLPLVSKAACRMCKAEFGL